MTTNNSKAATEPETLPAVRAAQRAHAFTAEAADTTASAGAARLPK